MWFPRSATLPSCKTMISSAPTTVLRRWATTRVVRPLLASSMACWMAFSVCVSRAEVASSRIRTRGFRSRARAMPSLCFSPPLRRSPRSPTLVS
mmetsp:Transcript_25244/g.73751  ORF Transcript_25244/g.73751 Transcript_25244/m.73751 type:complete len:94 (+) Transcript_25244:128-409(+)